MSHYSVAVITETGYDDEVMDLLEPFDENKEVETYIYRTKETIIQEGKECKEATIERIKNVEDKDKLIKYLIDPNYQFIRNILSAETDEDFYAIEIDGIDEEWIDKYGNELSTYNPDSKWDWWEIGGRWGGSLRDFNGEYHDTLKIADWDYNYIDPADLARANRFWEVIVEGAEQEEGEDFFSLYRPDYYIEKYGNKSAFVKNWITFSTYALLTPDGEWLEPGQMGWWGISNATPTEEGMWEKYYLNLIASFDKDYYITIVDCHI